MLDTLISILNKGDNEGKFEDLQAQESRSGCGCGGGSGSSLTLPLLLGALFLATAFLNNQIIMGGGGRKRRKRQIENIFKSFISEPDSQPSQISASYSARDYGCGCGCNSDSSNLLPLLLGALALAVFFLNQVRFEFSRQKL